MSDNQQSQQIEELRDQVEELKQMVERIGLEQRENAVILKVILHAVQQPAAREKKKEAKEVKEGQ